MSTKYVVACDGSEAAERALKFAMDEAKEHNAEIVLAFVLEWSPYAFLTPEELEERHKRRKEELKRAHEAIVDPLLKKLSDAGIKGDAEIRYGHVAETLVQIAEDVKARQIYVGRTGHSAIANRLFGSVASSMAQIAPVPCTIVP